MTLSLTSLDFAPGGAMPKECSCEGADRSPQLAWSGVPSNAKSLALIVDDPDAPDPAAPKRVWVHWVLYNLPASNGGLAAGVKKLPEGARVGLNDWKRADFGGPCPPIGRHRYFHKLYALDVVLGDLGKATKKDLEDAMKGHVVAQAELIGTYEKKKP